MENQINVGDQNTLQTGQNATNGLIQFQEVSRVNRWKFFTLILFGVLIVLLASAGFILKSQYQHKSSKVVNENNSTPIINKSYYKLPFKNFTVVLERDGRNVDGHGIGATGRSFWGLPIQSTDENANLYYDSNGDTYYLSQPGGYATLSIIVDSDQLGYKVINNKEKYEEVECEWDLYDMVGNKTSAVSIKCTTTQTNPDDLNQRHISSTRNCYLPLKSNTYDNDTWLAYEQKAKPMGDVDLCELLVRIGLSDVYLEYNQKINNISTTGNWKTYNFIDDSMTFKYPGDWQAQREEVFGSRTVTEFRSKNTPVLELTVQGNYNQVNEQPYKSLGEFLGVRFERSKETVIDRQVARRIEDQGDPGHVIPYEEIVVFTPDKKAIVSLYYKSSSYDKTDANKILDQILSTFKFSGTNWGDWQTSTMTNNDISNTNTKAIQMLQAISEVQNIERTVSHAGRKLFYTPEGVNGDVVRVSLRESLPDDPHTSRIDTFNINIKTKIITVEDVVTGQDISLEEWKKKVNQSWGF